MVVVIVAHWPDGSETVIPDGAGVDFGGGVDVVFDAIEANFAAFPAGQCRFSYRPAAKAPIFEERETSTAPALDICWSPE